LFERGNIYRHPEFKFHDGEIGDKLILLLNTPSNKEHGIFVKTTSQQHNKPSTVGCIKSHRCFYIDANSELFDLNTWIQLDDIYEFDANAAKRNDGLHKIGTLNDGKIDKIIDCLLLVLDEDLPKKTKEVLKPSMESSVEMLAEKFKRLN
jgi:hypothetical protein